ncbi:Uncharacterized protein TPAR_07266 [Tolypocladium paradoxum]|uniref:Uncharacterized protein n=1 Tax=Tolypocladium paradoxum TaxID=94208 RepID=A0A2S4KQR5_9HYPO|nr:Uncharacterized protein TPAR_07266 [Tolypocladium paradoxum]
MEQRFELGLNVQLFRRAPGACLPLFLTANEPRRLSEPRSSSTMARWLDFPPEIRLMILGFVARHYSDKSEPGARADTRRSDCLSCRSSSVPRRTGEGVEHLQLVIRLKEYGCNACQSEEDDETIEENRSILTRALMKLLRVLSKWKRSGCLRRDQGQRGLTLELGAYPPSDLRHVFRDFRLEDDYPYRIEADQEREFNAYGSRAFHHGKLNDPFHGWTESEEDDKKKKKKETDDDNDDDDDNLPRRGSPLARNSTSAQDQWPDPVTDEPQLRLFVLACCLASVDSESSTRPGVAQDLAARDGSTRASGISAPNQLVGNVTDGWPWGKSQRRDWRHHSSNRSRCWLC